MSVNWSRIYRIIGWLAVSILVTGCGIWPASQARPDVALTITGSVAKDRTWDTDGLKSMGLMELVSMNPSGEEAIWQGVLLTEVLDAAEPDPAASQVVFTDSRGNRVEMPLSEAMTCKECLVAFDPTGIGLNLAMPGQPAELWVENLVSIEIQ
jgi:DMSO/TMAO reductase YedYZ molybdopterin-dependent catalytic subunit